MTALSKLSRPLWMDRFGERLMRLEPSMNAISAAAHAVECSVWADDLDPEEAAEIFACTGGAGPDDCGTPE